MSTLRSRALPARVRAAFRAPGAVVVGSTDEQKARFQSEAFTRTTAAIRDAVGDASATVEVHGATPYVSYTAAIQNIADLERNIADSALTDDADASRSNADVLRFKAD